MGMRRRRGGGASEPSPGHCSTLHSTVQHSTAQYSTVQHSTVQYSTVQYSTVQHSTAQYSTAQYSTVQHSTVQLEHKMSAPTIVQKLFKIDKLDPAPTPAPAVKT